jgi:hypothetical protein
LRPASLPTATTCDCGCLSLIAAIRQEVLGVNGDPNIGQQRLQVELASLRSGRLDLMHATIPSYYLYGIEAIPTEVIVEPGGVQVMERETGRVLATAPAPGSCTQASM